MSHVTLNVVTFSWINKHSYTLHPKKERKKKPNTILFCIFSITMYLGPLEIVGIFYPSV